MPLSEPEMNPFGSDEVEFDVYKSQVRCLQEAIAQQRESAIEELPQRIATAHMLVYLSEMDTQFLVERLNGLGLNGRIVWQEALKAFQQLHGKEN